MPHQSYPVMCRACGQAGFVGGDAPPDHCPACASQDIRSHAELFTLLIAHVDCDAFYASIEKRDDPSIRDRPVIVGGQERGVVAAACYIARQYGVRSAMPTWQALKRCPDAVVIRPRMDHYVAIGRQIRDHMLALTPLVQPISIDEAFLDMAGTQKLHGCSPAEALVRMQNTIRNDIGITVSVGLSGTKSLAKMASDRDKPDGFFTVGMAEARDWLAPQPVSVLFGLGKSAVARLQAAGITSFDGGEFYQRRGLGQVAENFSSSEAISELPGFMAAGHVRYSTTGGSGLRNIQPLYADLASGGFSVAHNGNISNAGTLRQELVGKGAIFQSTSDTEVIIHLVATSRYPTMSDRLIDALADER